MERFTQANKTGWKKNRNKEWAIEKERKKNYRVRSTERKRERKRVKDENREIEGWYKKGREKERKEKKKRGWIKKWQRVCLSLTPDFPLGGALMLEC
jgi:hypothetical protein